MKTYILGIRGFPNVQGGAEKHSEELYRRLAKADCDITVFTRTPYIQGMPRPGQWEGIKFQHIWSPRKTGLETIIHTFLGTLRCLIKRPNIVHVHNIGPGLFIPLLKLAGLHVVMTYHSINYEHNKWGKFAKTMLRLGEYFSLNFADRIIVVSRSTQNLLENKYRRHDLQLIPNGVNLPTILPPGETLKQFKLKHRNYVFLASRFSQEKGVRDLVEAYAKIKNPEFNLVIAGDADQETSYSRELKRRAQEIPGIVLTGFISGRPLQELYSNAGLFVLPSYHEGMPIALLEALSYGLPVLISDIPQNKDIPLPEYRFFPVGNVDVLAQKLVERFHAGISKQEKDQQKALLETSYNWDLIAKRTYEVYKSIREKSDSSSCDEIASGETATRDRRLFSRLIKGLQGFCFQMLKTL